LTFFPRNGRAGDLGSLRRLRTRIPGRQTQIFALQFSRCPI
jgi:hypothetical protein